MDDTLWGVVGLEVHKRCAVGLYFNTRVKFLGKRRGRINEYSETKRKHLSGCAEYIRHATSKTVHEGVVVIADERVSVSSNEECEGLGRKSGIVC